MDTTDPETILDSTLAFDQLPTDVQDLVADWPARRAASREETTMNQPTAMPTTNPATTVDWGELHEELAHPFPDSTIRYRVGAVSRDKTKAQALPYVDVRAYEDRLNTLVPGSWSVEFEPWGEGRIICRLTIHGVTRSSTGDGARSPNPIAGTAAEAQAFKRACAKFGLGRHLYDLPAPWVDYDASSNRIRVPGPKHAPATSATSPRPEMPEAPSEPSQDSLGRTRAATMHRELARLGIPRSEHRAFAERVLGYPVQGFDDLSEAEARQVWTVARRPRYRARAG